MFELSTDVDSCFFFFFFQAEDGIRDDLVTGVQTCALPISFRRVGLVAGRLKTPSVCQRPNQLCERPEGPSRRMFAAVASSRQINEPEIGRASCRERV